MADDAVKVSVEGPVELKPADAIPVTPVVQKVTQTTATVTTTGPQPPPQAEVATHNEITRRQIVWMIFIQWNALLFAVLGAMVLKGWEISPVTGNVIMIAMTSETTLLAAVGAFYLGMQYQSKVQQGQ